MLNMDLYYTDSHGHAWMERYQVSRCRTDRGTFYVVVDLDDGCKAVSKEYIRHTNAHKKALNMNLDERKKGAV